MMRDRLPTTYRDQIDNYIPHGELICGYEDGCMGRSDDSAQVKEDITVACPNCQETTMLPAPIAELDYYQCVDCRYMIDLKAQR